MNDETQNPTPETPGLPSGDAFPPADPQAQAAAAEVSLAEKEAIFRDTPEGQGIPRPEIPVNTPTEDEAKADLRRAIAVKGAARRRGLGMLGLLGLGMPGMPSPEEILGQGSEHGEEKDHDIATCPACIKFRQEAIDHAEQNRKTLESFIADIQKEMETGVPLGILASVAFLRPEDDPEAPHATALSLSIGGHRSTLMRLMDETKKAYHSKCVEPAFQDFLRGFFEQTQADATAEKPLTPSTAADTPHDGHEA